MKKQIIRASALALFLLLTLNFSSCSTKEDYSTVRSGYFPNIIHTQALLMKNQGTLEERWNGVCNVAWTSFNAGPAEIEAIFSG